MPQETDVHIGMPRGSLAGDLVLPESSIGLVLFAHGSGSGRLSPRNRFVAQVLQEAGLATLLFDLLTESEDRTYANRFDIDLLTERLLNATDAMRQRPDTDALPLGYFGASTGAAAALKAAARLGTAVQAVVSRGGRPDLAGSELARVTAPTLLIVGGHDEAVIQLNQQARALMTVPAELKIVPGATHLFEEPGTLEQAAQAARDWFVSHLVLNPSSG